jgi:hypothetical protein
VNRRYSVQSSNCGALVLHKYQTIPVIDVDIEESKGREANDSRHFRSYVIAQMFKVQHQYVLCGLTQMRER